MSTKSPRKGKEPAHGYEFFGPPGVTILTIGLPILCYVFAFACNDVSGCPAPALLHPRSLTWEKLAKDIAWPGVTGLFNVTATLWLLAYYLLGLVLFAALPGDIVNGTELSSGGRLKYKFNAFSTAMLILTAAAVGTLLQGADFVLWTFIWDQYVPLITANVLISFALATYVYVRSFEVKRGNKTKRELAAGGHSGNLIYDWFIGRELNPRVTLPLLGEIDIKAFCELRPGMLGYMLLDFAFIAHQYKLHGFVTDSILMITVFQSLYVLDGLYNEPAILTTMDITTDGFGFMLAFGDLVWLPFTYSLQTRYLAVYPKQLGMLGFLGVLAVQGLGFYIFRATNNEKNRFRTNPRDPRVAHLQYITTRTGSKLLTSGWWGASRHINYLGDWIMGWSYVLPTGLAGYVITQAGGVKRAVHEGYVLRDAASSTGSTRQVVQGEARGWGMLITYFYMIYFAVLLVHRQLRDEEKCARKYGADWDEYRRRVEWRIVPYVY